MPELEPPTGDERLSKRVAALRSCSRSEAERLIAGGWVLVDGRVVDDPAHRVRGEGVSIEAGAEPGALVPVTLLWHKPAGLALTQDQPLTRLPETMAPGPRMAGLRPWHRRQLRCAGPMPGTSSGLAVFVQDPRVLRKLHDDGAGLEEEWMLDLPCDCGPDQIARLTDRAALLGTGHRPPHLKLSVNSQRPDHTRLRLAAKGARAGQLDAWLGSAGLHASGLHRLRLGRMTLGTLATGAWRVLEPHERF